MDAESWNFNDLLQKKNINPEHVLVLRHVPKEPELKKVLPWLAAERPDWFNAYQQTQGETLEKVMQKMSGFGYIASFIGQKANKALYVGLYSIVGSKRLTYDEYWNIPANIALKDYGVKQPAVEEQPTPLWFELALTDFYSSWKGKLIVDWPPPGLAWWRHAHRNEIPIHAILEDSELTTMPEWNDVDLTWEQLGILPLSWRSALSQWRGIYYIFDTSDRKGYVGSAYGELNLLGRWLNYAASGDGGDRLLQQRDPLNFRFTILERVSPDMKSDDVIALEESWKQRLHTILYGLNLN
jgi:hypothetical protein